MDRIRKAYFLWPFFFGVLLCAWPAWSETVDTSPDKNTIRRQFDHLVVLGSNLKKNLNKPIPQMRLYAFRNKKMLPIPFQIDEVTGEGDWVLPNKSPYLSEQEANQAQLIKEDPPEVMDNNDELVFMAIDIGDRAATPTWPANWLHADEITITDPLTGEHGWVYLFSFTNAPEPSSVDYVKHQLPPDEEDIIRTDIYTQSFSQKVPLTQRYSAFNDGDNIIDRLKTRIYYSFFSLIKFDRNENDMDSKLWQYKDGPVRAIRLVRSSLRLIGKLQSPKVNHESFFYREATEVSFRMNIIRLPGGVVDEAIVDSGGDYRDLYGWKVRLSTDERWLAVDGKMDDIEKSIKTDNARWYILKGPEKALIVSMHFAENYGLKTKFSYLDDDVNEFPPESETGQVPYIGCRIIGLENIADHSAFHLKIMTSYLKGESSEQQLLQGPKIMDTPLQISVQGFNSTNQRAAFTNQP